jgi:adenine/guanine phosphoribosyltransferase-like PRPP-binding protein
MSLESHDEAYFNSDSYEDYSELDGFEPDLATSYYQSRSIDEIRYRMLYSVALLNGVNVPFSEVMRNHEHANIDLIVATANSAVPVADAVRGWHEATGSQPPEMTYVRANRELSGGTSVPGSDHHQIIDDEYTRFRDNYGGRRALIIDQFVFTGNTLNLAANILRSAGVEVVGTSQGAQWYNHAYGHLDLERMTSEHAKFMRNVGREAVAAANEKVDDWQ